MSGTFSQIYIQVVFAVNGRENLLDKKWRDDVFKYMTGIIKNKGQKSIIVNGMPDHLHVFIGLRPSMSIDAITRDIKNYRKAVANCSSPRLFFVLCSELR